jgi:hypothetical protein
MKLLPLFEGMFGKSAETKQNEKIAAMLQKKFGGSYPFLEIADLHDLHHRAFVQAENEYLNDNNVGDYDDRYVDHPEFQDLVDKYTQEATQKFNVDYTLKFEYKDGTFLVIWTMPVSHMGGMTIDMLIKKLRGWFQYFSIEDFTLRCISIDYQISRKPYSYDVHVNGEEIFFPMKREEKKRQPYDPSQSIDPESGRPIH